MTPDARLARLTDGYVVTQLLWVAAELRIPDELAESPRTAEELAGKVGAHAANVRRVLRGLAAEEVFEELPGGRFGLTTIGELLLARWPSGRRARRPRWWRRTTSGGSARSSTSAADRACCRARSGRRRRGCR